MESTLQSEFLSKSFKNLFGIKRAASINSTVFRLHYKVTTPVLVFLSILLSFYQLFGKPISCMLPSVETGFPVSVVENYCWVESTFTLPSALDKKVGDQVPYPGVDKYVRGEEIQEHAYYQWVWLVLSLQACLFLVPYILWKGWEHGTLSKFVLPCDKLITAEEDRKKAYEQLFKNFEDRFGQMGNYFSKFFFCEILNFANVVGQIFLMDKFLNGEFSTYGAKAFQFLTQSQSDRVDPMIRVFPRLTKCNFHHFGPSGNVQKLDTLCVLPLNILNEKIYVFLWFWMVILAVLSGLAVLYRLMTLVLPGVRLLVTWALNYSIDRRKLEVVLTAFNSERWFVFYIIASNMDKMHSRELVDYFQEKIKDGALEYDKSTSDVSETSV